MDVSAVVTFLGTLIAIVGLIGSAYLIVVASIRGWKLARQAM